MTRRERLQRKLELRREWAERAEARSATAYGTAHGLTEGIPFGQPILVGHHSERAHRRVIERAQNAMQRSYEASKLAAHHDTRADGIERQLDRSIFSDDADAVERLGDRVADLTAKRDAMKAANTYWRKHKTMKGFPGLSDERAAQLDAEIPTRYSWARQPFAASTLTNMGARIRAAQKRVAVVEQRQDRAAQAEAAGGVALEECNGYTRVTFAEKPDRDTLNTLRAANYRWGGGSWVGPTDNLPECVSQLVGAMEASNE